MRKDIHIPLEMYYRAYYLFRNHCRDTEAQQVFEASYAYNLFSMRNDVINRRIDLGTSYAFIVDKPKSREIFAGSVYKRILDTLCMLVFLPAMEDKFSTRQYNVRKGFGLLQYQKRLCADMSEHPNSWVLGGDVKSFFMSIDKQVAWKLWKEVIEEWYGSVYTDEVLYIMHEIIFYSPEKHCERKSSIKSWNVIPEDKSLFTNVADKGLPIGDLVSQYTALLMLRRFALWLEKEYRNIGVYMDDFYIVGEHDALLDALPKIRKELAKVGLILNEDKTYFQSCKHGIKSCGVVAYPDRAYVSNRVVRNAKSVILEYTEKQHINAKQFCQRMNSYFGILGHFNTYNIRKRLVGMIPPHLWDKIYIKGLYETFKEKENDSKRNMRKG